MIDVERRRLTMRNLKKAAYRMRTCRASDWFRSKFCDGGFRVIQPQGLVL